MPFDGQHLTEPQRILFAAAKMARERGYLPHSRESGYGMDGGPRCVVGYIAEVVGCDRAYDIHRPVGSHYNKFEHAIKAREDLERYLEVEDAAHWHDHCAHTSEDVAKALEDTALSTMQVAEKGF